MKQIGQLLTVFVAFYMLKIRHLSIFNRKIGEK